MADPNLKLDVTVEMARGGHDPENVEYRGVIRGTVASFRALISALSLKIKQGEGIQSDITIRGHGGNDVRIELIGEPDTDTRTWDPAQNQGAIGLAKILRNGPAPADGSGELLATISCGEVCKSCQLFDVHMEGCIAHADCAGLGCDDCYGGRHMQDEDEDWGIDVAGIPLTLVKSP